MSHVLLQMLCSRIAGEVLSRANRKVTAGEVAADVEVVATAVLELREEIKKLSPIEISGEIEEIHRMIRDKANVETALRRALERRQAYWNYGVGLVASAALVLALIPLLLHWHP
jgi:hypothetical protein